MDPQKDEKGNLSSWPCSICLDLVLDRGERSIAKLHCGHEFHLDCIGSAFNAKGAMQCPNCRKVEKGQWLYASGNRSSADFEFDAWLTENFYDIGYSELPFGFQWCPFRGITQLASLFELGLSNTGPLLGAQGNSANRMYQTTVPHLPLGNARVLPTRRSRSRGFAPVSSQAATSGSRQDGLGPLPWIPFEGESQWWGPFAPDPARAENGYLRMPTPPSYM